MCTVNSKRLRFPSIVNVEVFFAFRLSTAFSGFMYACFTGLFIFLSFAASGRSLELYRAKIAMLRNRCPSNAAKNTARTKDKIVVTRSGKTSSPDVQDCEEIPL